MLADQQGLHLLRVDSGGSGGLFDCLGTVGMFVTDKAAEGQTSMIATAAAESLIKTFCIVLQFLFLFLRAALRVFSKDESICGETQGAMVLKVDHR